jgi:hypothetical protein
MRRFKIGIHLLPFVLILLLIIIKAEASPEEKLYERIAHSSLVIHGQTISDDAKYAGIHVLEVLKGDFTKENLQISFRMDNFEREREEEKIIFNNGEEIILLLEPLRDRSGRIKDPSLFRLMNRAEGKIDISPESGHLLIDAVKRFVHIQSLESQYEIWQEQKKLLQEKNRFLVQAGFQEILKFRIGDWSQIPTLLQYLTSPDVEFQRDSAKVISQLFQDKGNSVKKLEGWEEVIRTLIRIARGDKEARIRVEAIRTLSAADAENYQDVLEAISEDDESQLVRYEAQKVLYEIKTGKKTQ